MNGSTIGNRLIAAVTSLMLVASIAVTGTNGPAAAADTYTIDGQVTTGSFEAGGATVVIRDAFDNEVERTVADDTGNYSVDGLPAGTYTAFAIAPGNTAPFWHATGYVDPSVTAPTPIVLDAATPDATIDFDFPQGGFGGFLYNEAAGGDPTNPPLVPFATLGFELLDDGGNVIFAESAEVINGNFGLGYIPDGEYRVTAGFDNRFYTFPDPVFTNDETLGSLRPTIPLGERRITGTVVTEGDPYPVPNAQIDLVEQGGGSVATTLTAADGSFSFDNVFDGTYELAVSPDGNLNQFWLGSGYVTDTNPKNATQITIDDTNPEALDLAFVLPTGGFGGTVLPFDPDPSDDITPTLPDATVTFTQVDGTGTPTGFQDTAQISEFDVRISIGNLPLGDYTAVVDYGFNRTFSDPRTFTTGPTGFSLTIEVPISPGVVRGTVTTDGDDQLTLNGFVDPGPYPVPGAIVTVADATTGAPVMSGIADENGDYEIVDIDPGTYRIFVRAPGNQSRFWYQSGFSTVPTATEIVVDEITPLEDIDFALPTGGFGGYVNTQLGPAWGSITFEQVGGLVRETLDLGLDVPGGFGVGYLPLGDYRVSVRLGFGPGYTFPDLYTTGPTGLSLSLDVPGLVQGTVTTDGLDDLIAPGGIDPTLSGPQPIAGANVVLYNVDCGCDWVSAFTDEQGRYRLDGFFPGNYELYVTAPGNSTKLWFGGGFGERDDVTPTPITIEAGLDGFPATRGFDASVQFPTGGFGGVIKGESTETGAEVPLPGGIATFTDVATGYTETVPLDENGNYSLGYIPVGAYELTVQYEAIAGNGLSRSYTFPQTYSTGPIGFSLNPNPGVPVGPVLPGTVRGTVFDADGAPAGGALVRLFAAGDVVVAETTSEPDGFYTLTANPGIYRLIATQGDQAVEISPFFLAEDTATDQDLPMVDASGLVPLSGEFVDGEGGPFDQVSLGINCNDGTSQSIWNEFGSDLDTTISTSGCTAWGTLDNSDVTGDTRLASFYEFNLNPVPTGTDIVWSIPTTDITVNVVDGNDNAVAVSNINTNNNWQPVTADNGLTIQFGSTNLTNPNPGPATLQTLPAPNTQVTIDLPDGRSFTRTIDTTTGPVIAQLIVAGSGGIWLVSEAGEDLFDGDGVADDVERQVPSRTPGVEGDGNGDGVPDFQQANVASLPTASGNYVTLSTPAPPPPAGGEPAPPAPVLNSVQAFSAETGPPTAATWTAPPAELVTPEGILSFQVDRVDVGATITVEINVSDITGIAGWAKVDNEGNWTATLPITPVPERSAIQIELTDGGLGDDDGVANGVIVDPGAPADIDLYRARQDGDRIRIERNTFAATAAGLGISDQGADAQGWVTVGRTNGAGDDGLIANFWVEEIDGEIVPFVSTRHHKKGCLTLTPTSLDEVRVGQVRLMTQQANTENCRPRDPSDDVDGDGIPDDEQALYSYEMVDGRAHILRRVAAAEAQYGVSDWNRDATVETQGTGDVLYSRTSGRVVVTELVQNLDIDDDDVPDPLLLVEHPRKGCQVLAPNRTDTVAVGQTRRMYVDNSRTCEGVSASVD